MALGRAVSIDDQVLTEIDSGHVAGNGVLVEQASEGLHILSRALTRWALVQCLLQIVNVDGAERGIVEACEVLHGCTVAVDGGFPLFMGGLPGIVHLA